MSDRRQPSVAGAAGSQVWAALVLGVEAVVAVVAAAWWGWEIAQGHTREVARSVVELVLFLLAAAGFVALAGGLLRGARWPRTPTVVWHGLLAPVAVSLWQSGEVVVAALVTLGITVAVLGILLSRPAPTDGRG
ncbi:hypothetical protein [Arsenicicoccus sp. oral taxon 190]|uniref:hypothetical protein n=1 Tax=Arsenicicoccus sp. oral taxon 190 TaxID=1658671 RepID=UPI00067A0052|nr:hypothetical protein [Arsenicicoccus sp. oral taxon 190]AKT51445.1 hypothetical protein ADJ73_09175 [Arsenicicoccus sp. oral taxon 190]